MHHELNKVQPVGFTLVAVLVVMAAMLLLAVGVLAVVGIERKTARSYIEAKRAEWAARAGMEELRGLLCEQTANDDFLIVGTPAEDSGSGKEPLNYLYLARGAVGGGGVEYSLYPLFSTTGNRPAAKVSDLQDLPEPRGLAGSGPASFQPLAYGDEVVAAWIPIEDESGRPVARYAYWVEDLQGKIDGSIDWGSGRAAWPFPAPGVRDDAEAPEIALDALDPEAGGNESGSELVERLVDGRALMVSPGSVLAAADFSAPLERDDDGMLVDPQAASLDRNVSAVIQPYEERANVPFAAGINPGVMGLPKMNLNALLAEDREAAVERFAGWVGEALPKFEERQGGFPEDYLQTLAAGALDYADKDSEPTVKVGSYRGMDSYPLVSEHLMKFRWEDFETIDGQKYFVLTGTVYVELWNMSDQEIEGDIQVSYETGYLLDLVLLSGIELGSDEVLGDPAIVSGGLINEDGVWWLPEQSLAQPLKPNEYRIVNAGTVTYRFPETYVPSPVELYGEEEGVAGYKLRFNGLLADRSFGDIVRREMRLFYPTRSKPETAGRLRQRIETSVPGLSYSVPGAAGGFGYVNNMGDPRQAYYIDLPQSPNKYGNYSPSRRAVRWNTVYKDDASTKPKVYGRTLPSEWPDGGHDSDFGSIPAPLRTNGDNGDQRVDPDDPSWIDGVPDPVAGEAPMRISNLGRFYSATELGRVFDPLMWLPTYRSSSDSNRIRGGLMPSGQSSWPNVAYDAPVSSHHGGGNTLRIGRAEHPKFELRPGAPEDAGRHAAHLLDIFHAGKPTPGSERRRQGEMISMAGRVNVNTAPEDVLRALVIGNLRQDPKLSLQQTRRHEMGNTMAPPVIPLELGAPGNERAGDVIAEALMRGRPFASAAEMAGVEDSEGKKVFGNPAVYPADVRDKIQWSDSAAEELFARLYESSTVRSRNFRIWVVGQALAPRHAGSTAEPVVLSESRKAFTIFADPGERGGSGEIDPDEFEPRTIYENEF